LLFGHLSNTHKQKSRGFGYHARDKGIQIVVIGKRQGNETQTTNNEELLMGLEPMTSSLPRKCSTN
jgi:hypothetical protein